MTLEIGKTYLSRDGTLLVTVLREVDTCAPRGTYRVLGRDQMGRITFHSRKGRFERHPHRLDLIEEAA